MSKSMTTKLNEDAKRAIAGMNDQLRKLYERCDERRANRRKGDVLSSYDEGADIDKAMGDQKTYGENAAQKLAAALGIDTQELYRLRKVAQVWSRGEIEKLVERRSKQGNRLITFGHLWLVAGCTQQRTRDALLSKFFNEGTTIREFKAAIQQKLGKRGSGTGRPRLMPKGPSAGLAAMNKKTEDWLASFEGWDVAIFENLGNKPGEYASADLIEELEKAIDEQTKLEEHARTAKSKLTAALDATRKAFDSNGPPVKTSTPSRSKVGKRKSGSTSAEASNGAAPKKTAKKKSAAKKVQDAKAAVEQRRTVKKKKRPKPEPELATA